MKRFETVTIYRKNLTPDGVSWSAKCYKTFSVCFKELLSSYDDDTCVFYEASVRINAENHICFVGDMIYFGDNPPSIPNDKAYTIVEVANNFSSSPSMRHVRLLAK